MTLLLAALFCLQQTDEDVAALLRLLNSKDPVISSHAEETLLEIGPRAIPHLERAEKSSAAKERERLQRMIKEIREFEAGLEGLEIDRLPELLAKLDARALNLQRRFSRKTGKPAHVAAVLEGQHAEKLGAANSHAFATYSFDFETRGRRKLVRTDWDFSFDQGRIRVRTVTDDRSEIWSMGKEFEKLALDDKTVRKLADMPVVAKGEVYVIHTDDTDSNLWTKMQILEQRPGQWILFRWDRITDAADMLKLERTPERLLKSGEVRLQIRAGHGGGNPMKLHLDGGKNAYLDSISAVPLKMDAAPDRGERSAGFITGGLIPIGKVWVLRRAQIRANWDDAGSFQVSVKGKVLASAGRGAKEGKGLDETWAGRIVVRPGEERTVFAEASYYTRCDILFSGAIWDERFADVESFPELEGADKAKAERLVKDLASDDIVTREQAVHDLVEWGPPVLGHLQTVDGSKKSPEYRALLKEVIRRLGGD